MPNWTKNRIFFCNDDSDKYKNSKGEPIFGEGSEASPLIDFNKVLPMPESLKIVSSPPEEAAVLAYVTEKFTKPVTDTIVDTVLNICHDKYWFGTFEESKAQYEAIAKEKDPDEDVVLSYSMNEEEEQHSTLYEKGKIYVDNYNNYGAPTWFEWACMMWGVKWNASESRWCDDDIIEFETAWNAPVGYYEELARQYPELHAKVVWADEDYGSGAGAGLIKSGKFRPLFFPSCSVEAFRIVQYVLGEYYYEDDFGNESYSHNYKIALKYDLEHDIKTKPFLGFDKSIERLVL